MVKGVSKRRKRYVEVISRTDAEGAIRPMSIIWPDGRIFMIDQILDYRRSASLKVGGTGIRYVVRIGSSETYLYYEDPRWFVEEIIPDSDDSGY